MLTLSKVAASGTEMAIGDAGITAVLGYAVVFAGLIMLMYVIILAGKIMVAKSKKKAVSESAAKDAVSAVPTAAKEPAAPGSAGDIKLYDVSDKDAAMIMAIVADKTGKPLNELRFKSIREVK